MRRLTLYWLTVGIWCIGTYSAGAEEQPVRFRTFETVMKELLTQFHLDSYTGRAGYVTIRMNPTVASLPWEGPFRTVAREERYRFWQAQTDIPEFNAVVVNSPDWTALYKTELKQVAPIKELDSTLLPKKPTDKIIYPCNIDRDTCRSIFLFGNFQVTSELYYNASKPRIDLQPKASSDEHPFRFGTVVDY